MDENMNEDVDIIKYKFNEPHLLEEFQEYIKLTYHQHYAGEKKNQVLEEIIDDGHGMGFCMGNIKKYSGRYGKKNGKNRDDLFKTLHYALLAIYIHDLERSKKYEQEQN